MRSAIAAASSSSSSSSSSAPAHAPTKSELTEEELRAKEENDFKTGPFSVLHNAVRNNNQVLVSCRNNRKLLGCVLAFDRHMNMVMVNVRELWSEMPKATAGGAAAASGKLAVKPVNKDRFIPKLFIRGDSVILVVRNKGT